MGYYDNCRKENCGICGQLIGHCEHTKPKPIILKGENKMINATQAKQEYQKHLEKVNEKEIELLKDKIKSEIEKSSKTSSRIKINCKEKFHKPLKLWLEEYGYIVECEKEYFGDSREFLDYGVPAHITIIWSKD